MSEKVPLLRCPLADMSVGYMVGDIPDICQQQCEQLWDEAIRKDIIDGPYDMYNPEQHEEYCPKANISDTEYSSSALHKLKGSKRDYVVVDECTSCGIEIGEQGYIFNCPANNIPD